MQPVIPTYLCKFLLFDLPEKQSRNTFFPKPYLFLGLSFLVVLGIFEERINTRLQDRESDS